MTAVIDLVGRTNGVFSSFDPKKHLVIVQAPLKGISALLKLLRCLLIGECPRQILPRSSCMHQASMSAWTALRRFSLLGGSERQVMDAMGFRHLFGSQVCTVLDHVTSTLTNSHGSCLRWSKLYSTAVCQGWSGERIMGGEVVSTFVSEAVPHASKATQPKVGGSIDRSIYVQCSPQVPECSRTHPNFAELHF